MKGVGKKRTEASELDKYVLVYRKTYTYDNKTAPKIGSKLYS